MRVRLPWEKGLQLISLEWIHREARTKGIIRFPQTSRLQREPDRESRDQQQILEGRTKMTKIQYYTQHTTKSTDLLCGQAGIRERDDAEGVGRRDKCQATGKSFPQASSTTRTRSMAGSCRKRGPGSRKLRKEDQPTALNEPNRLPKLT